MRRRRRGASKSKYMIVLLMASILVFVGGTYAAWNDDNNIISKLSTGKLEFMFAREEEELRYEFTVVDKQMLELEKLEVEAELSEDNRRLKLDFKKGVPVDKLVAGNLIKFRFPIENTEDGNYDNIKMKKVNFNENGSEQSFAVKEVFLNFAGNSYLLGENVYAIDLNFRKYQFTETDEKGEVYAGVYLKLSDSSRAALENMPKEFEIAEKDLLAMQPDETVKEQPDGIMVRYSSYIDIGIDQAGAAQD